MESDDIDREENREDVKKKPKGVNRLKKTLSISTGKSSKSPRLDPNVSKKHRKSENSSDTSVADSHCETRTSDTLEQSMVSSHDDIFAESNLARINNNETENATRNHFGGDISPDDQLWENSHNEIEHDTIRDSLFINNNNNTPISEPDKKLVANIPSTSQIDSEGATMMNMLTATMESTHLLVEELKLRDREFDLKLQVILNRVSTMEKSLIDILKISDQNKSHLKSDTEFKNIDSRLSALETGMMASVAGIKSIIESSNEKKKYAADVYQSTLIQNLERRNVLSKLMTQ